MISPTVLLMLDELHCIEVYGNHLCGRGYKIVNCLSLSEGMYSLETQPVSMVIVGQGTPAFEGRQMLRQSRELHPEVPVLVLARVMNIQCYLEAMDLGALDYLESPSPRDLTGVVDMQMLRCALAGMIEWHRLSPIFSSSFQDHFQKPPGDGWVAPSTRWEIPKGAGTELLLRPRGNAKGFGTRI